MSAAVAFSSHDIEKDPTIVGSVVVECPVCDPDNPLAVDRAKCPRCQGAGTTRPLVAEVAAEIHASRLQLLVGDDED